MSLGGCITSIKLALANAYPCTRFQRQWLTELKDSKGLISGNKEQTVVEQAFLNK